VSRGRRVKDELSVSCLRGCGPERRNVESRVRKGKQRKTFKKEEKQKGEGSEKIYRSVGSSITDMGGAKTNVRERKSKC